MDDPWGSPWASDNLPSKHEPHEPAPSPPKALLSPPPKAFFGSVAAAIAPSPWATNDAFGDWESPEDAEDPALSPGWGSWGDSGGGVGRGGAAAPSSISISKAGSPGKQSPIAWPSSAATSPGLRPGLRSRSSSVFRQPSPDPWALSSPWGEVEGKPLPIEARVSPAQDEDESQTSETNKLVIRVNGPETVEGSHGEIMSAQGGGAGAKPFSLNNDDGLDVIRDERGPVSEEHGTPSRPSSTFSVGSDRGIDRQDSPITSIDEEPKSRPQCTARKSSGKVSELVGLYDGLARAASEEPPEPERPSSIRSTTHDKSTIQHESSSAGETVLERADGEESQDHRASQGIAPFNAPEKLSAPKASSEEPASTQTGVELSIHQSPSPKTSSIAVQQLIEKFRAMKFDLDPRNIDQLFAGIPKPVESNHFDGAPELDRVITDSFTTVDERKTWYRISRYGSMRKHNSGDDENYHRVTWMSSQLHNDTIKVVRRWMEEDSFSGKPTLGGTKRTSVFNWDSSAIPVDLNEVFAQRRPYPASKPNPVAPPPGHAQHSSYEPSVNVTESPRPSTDWAVPSKIDEGTRNASTPMFGWHSPQSNPPLIAAHPPPNQTGLAAAGQEGLPLRIDSDTSVSSKTITTGTPSLPMERLVLSSKADHSADDDDDDDWGEMIMSPTQAAAGAPMKPLGQMREDTLVPSLNHEDSAKEQAPEPVLASFFGEAARDSIADATPPHLSDLPPKTDSIQDQPMTLDTIADLSGNSDPWSSADFSVFDMPQQPQPIIISTTPTEETARVHALPSSEDEAIRKSMSSDAVRTEPEARAEVKLGPIQSSQVEQEAEIVRRIVQSLPDLTYMLSDKS